MIGKKALTFLAGVLLFVAVPVYGAEFFAGEETIVGAPADEDVYVLSSTIAVNAPVGGDLALMGSDIVLVGRIAEDATVLGGNVIAKGAIGDDLRFVGGTLTIEGTVHGDVAVFAGKVTIAPDAHIYGELHVFAGEVESYGRVDGVAVIQSGMVTFGGRMEDDVQVIAKDGLLLNTDATFGGDLTYSAPHEVEPRTLTGELSRIPLARASVLSPSDIAAGMLGVFGTLAPLQVLGLLIATFIVYWLTPRFTDDVGTRAIQKPLRSALLGAAFMFGGALISLFFAITIVGFFIAWALFLMYMLILLLALLYRPVVLGALLGRIAGKPLGQSITPWTIGFGVPAIVVIGAVPGIGGLATLALWLMALGSFVELLWYKIHGQLS